MTDGKREWNHLKNIFQMIVNLIIEYHIWIIKRKMDGMNSQNIIK